jgi:hypothetical protein
VFPIVSMPPMVAASLFMVLPRLQHHMSFEYDELGEFLLSVGFAACAFATAALAREPIEIANARAAGVPPAADEPALSAAPLGS